MKHKENKYRLEKVLHELIKDLPEVERVNRLFESGFITSEDAYQAISEIIRQEKERSKTA